MVGTEVSKATAACVFANISKPDLCFIPVDLSSGFNVQHLSSWRLGGSRVKLTLVNILQGCGNCPHIHLNTAGPVLYITNFLYEMTKQISGCDLVYLPV